MVVGYHLLFWNRFLPVQEGWFHAMADRIRAGSVPYRDFHAFLPPLYLWLLTGVTSIFGNVFAVMRAVGIVERAITAVVLAALYRRAAGRSEATFLALVTCVVSWSFTTDLVYGYQQTCLLFALLSAWLLAERGDPASGDGGAPRPGAARARLAAAGALGGLAFLTKQTTGLFVPAAIAAELLLRARDANDPAATVRRPARYRDPALYLAGAATPVVLAAAVLAAHGALVPCVDQVFRSGAAAKGSLVTALFGFLPRLLGVRELVAAGAIAGLYAWWRHREGRAAAPGDAAAGGAGEGPGDGGARRGGGELPVAAWMAVGAGALLLPWFAEAFFAATYKASGFYEAKLALVRVAFIAMAAILAASLRGRLAPWRLLALVSLATMWAHGLSFTLEEHAALPALGVALAAVLRSRAAAARIAVAAGGIVLLALCAHQKYAWPYQWWGWREPPVRTATETVDLPALRGLRLNPETARAVTGIVDAVRANSRAGEPIVTFPHVPLFALLADRPIATFSVTHYFDVCSDDCARADARRLRESPPAVAVVVDLPEEAWRFHEEAFRRGGPSGQREIAAELERLAAERGYRRAARVVSMEGTPIEVWARPPAP